MKRTRHVTDRQIVVKGASVGNLTPGTVIDLGTPLTEVLERLLTTYSNPKGTLSASVSAVEAGTVLSATLSATFSQGDAGPLTSYTLRRNGALVLSETTLTSYSETSRIGEETLSYAASFAHGEGTLPAGTLTATASIQGKRATFYGVDSAAASSAQIRQLPGGVLGAGNGSSFTINIPAGTASVVFAYPATLRDVSVVKHNESNFDVKEVFTLTTVNVEGAGGYQAIAYKVYRYVPAAAFTTNNTYTVTI